MIYVVLGMHKSGTTLVAQILHKSGINMGELDESLGYDEDNKYERHQAQELNRALLDGYLIPPVRFLLRRSSLPTYDQAGYRPNSDSQALVRYAALRQSLAEKDHRALRSLVEACEARYDHWGMKDPRTCLTYAAWRAVLPEHRIIVVYRHYSQLLSRYRVNNWQIPRLFRILNSWTLHNSAILEALSTANVPYVVLSYERLMEDDGEFRRLQAFTGSALVDARDRSLYRHRAEPENKLPLTALPLLPFLPEDPRTVYTQLAGLRQPVAKLGT